MGRSAYLTVAIIAASITATTVHAGSAAPIFAPASLSSESTTDISDEPSVVIGTGDFNRDGIADMVEAISLDGKDAGRHSLVVLLGKADGTFASVASYKLSGSSPRALVVADFNGDSYPDVILGDDDGMLREFLGDGKGDLNDAGNIATVGSVASLAIGHFTHGGHLDLVVSDFQSNSAVILLGAGNGSFRHSWSFQLPRAGRQFRIVTADFNKDGIADLVITSEDDDNYEVMLGNGNGTFTYAPELSHLRDPYSYCPT